MKDFHSVADMRDITTILKQSIYCQFQPDGLTNLVTWDMMVLPFRM
jgi:hypothetical protein